jgi:hypothetical protein
MAATRKGGRHHWFAQPQKLALRSTACFGHRALTSYQLNNRPTSEVGQRVEFAFAETRLSSACFSVQSRRRRPSLIVGARAVSMFIALGWSLAGCVGGDDGQAVFAGHDSSSAFLIQWTDDGKGVLAGSVQVADKAPGTSGPGVKQTTLTFSGKLDSGKVSLQIQDLGETQTWNATLNGDELRVNFPEGGGLETITLARASSDVFNADVAALEAEVVQTRNEAARAATAAGTEAEKKEAEAAAKQLFDDAVDDLAVSRETILALLPDPPELRALPQKVTLARANLAKAKAAADEAALHFPGPAACELAHQAKDAAGDVAGNASVLKKDSRAAIEAAKDLAAARSELAQAYARLQLLSEHSGQSSKPGSAIVEPLIDKARASGIRWRTAANKAEKTMESMVSQSRSLAEAAQSASC